MAINMNLRDLRNPQYTAVTGRRSNTPYAAYLTAMGPSVRDAALRQQDLLTNQTQFNASQALERTKIDAAESQTKKAQVIQGVGTAVSALALANQAGLIDLKDIASTVKNKIWPQTSTNPIFSSPEAASEAMYAGEAGGVGGTPIGSLTEFGTLSGDTITPAQAAEAMYASEAGGVGSTSVGSLSGDAGASLSDKLSGAGAVVAAITGAVKTRDRFGELDQPMDERSYLGKFSSTPLVSTTPNAILADLVDQDTGMAKSAYASRELEESVFGRPLSMAVEGDIVGSHEAMIQGFKESPKNLSDATKNLVTSSIAGDVTKTIAGEDAGNIVTAIFNPVGAIAGGTWLCTEIKKRIGMTSQERSSIRKLRRYARKSYPGWLNSYQVQGPELIRGIAERAVVDLNQFYGNLKPRLVDTVVGLIDAGEMEAAFTNYKDETIRLCREYAPDVRIEEIKEAAR